MANRPLLASPTTTATTPTTVPVTLPTRSLPISKVPPRGSSQLPHLAHSTTAPANTGNNVRPIRREDAPPTPTMEWGEFLRYFQQEWHQGEHVTMIGTTGSGKTTLLEQVIGIRSYHAIF